MNEITLTAENFDEKVLKAVGRTPSQMPIPEIVSILHAHGATVNTDFLYGLPYQTPDTFVQDIQKTIEVRPERLVTFSYGHVPWVFKRQQVLEKIGLPQPEVKQQMYDKAAELELYQALQNGQLYRNFQGYCTRRTTGQVYAFGVTGISQLDSFYAQNTKSIEEYLVATENDTLSTAKGYQLTPEQRIVKEVIERLMCNYRIQWAHIAKDLGITIEQVKAALHYDAVQLQEMADDGIMNLSHEGITMTTEGHPFVRNVAAALDPLMVHTDKKFSKPI